MTHHLAQINIARMRAPLDDPVMQGFVAGLNEFNALAEASPGFVWRLQTDDGDATSIRAFDDPMLLINMSVWESVEALRDYVYRSRHRNPLRKRSEWFAPMQAPHLALWWVPAGHRPTIEEGKQRLEHLAAHGPGPEAFGFRTAQLPDAG